MRYEFYSDDVTVTSFINIRYCNVATKASPLSVNNRPVKRLTMVTRLPTAFYTVPYAGWNYGIVTPFSQLKIWT